VDRLIIVCAFGATILVLVALVFASTGGSARHHSASYVPAPIVVPSAAPIVALGGD
jgi:hypothetical protein